MSDRATVSVIVLSFNRRDETIDCLRALMKQTYLDIELVVLDNGSHDDSVEAIRADFPSAKLLEMPRNYGDWEGRDIALKNCTGEYVMLVDSDAVIQPDAVETLLSTLVADPWAAAVQPAIQDTTTDRMYNTGFGRDQADKRFFKAVFHGCTVLFRTNVLRDAGGFPHLLLGGAEDFLSYRFYDAGYRVLYEPSVVVRHLMSSKERVPKKRLMYQSMQKLHAKVAHVYGTPRLFHEIIRGILAYSYHNLKSGHLAFYPIGLWNHIVAVVTGLQKRRPISKNAMELQDTLRHTMISTEEEFQRVDTRPKCKDLHPERQLPRTKLLR